MRKNVWANAAKALRLVVLSVAILFGLASILATGGGGVTPLILPETLEILGQHLNQYA